MGQTSLPFGPKVLNLCFDRGCNLVCPSCRKGFFRHDDESLRKSRLLARRTMEEGAPSVERLLFSGEGDPFASPVYREMLQRFDSDTFPRLKSIHLHTNGILWDEAMWRSMSSIHPYVSTAEISVDAASPVTYALNRSPARFEDLQERLFFVAALPISVTLSFVVQSNNLHEMEPFVALCRRYGFRAYFSALVNWGTFPREEYRRRGVHLPDHPQHEILKEIVRSLAHEEDVDLGILAPLAHNCGGD